MPTDAGDVSHRNERNQPYLLVYQTAEDADLPLPELAACLSLKAYLKINSVQFTTKYQHNAEHMSPSRLVPFVKIGCVLISDYESIVSYMAAEGIHPPSTSQQDQAERKAQMALIESVLTNAERYCAYILNPSNDSSQYAWPLNVLLNREKHRLVKKQLSASKWLRKTVPQIEEDVETFCNSLTENMHGEFFSESPNELDSLIYGHIRAILQHPSAGLLKRIVERNTTLMQFCQNFEATYPNCSFIAEVKS